MMGMKRIGVRCRDADVASISFCRLEEYNYLIKWNEVRYSLLLYLVELVLGYVYLLRLQCYSRSLNRALKVVDWNLETQNLIGY